MAIKAKYAQGNMNGYTMESSPYTLRAMEEAETEKNVKAGKSALKVLVVAVMAVVVMAVSSGCLPDGGPACYFVSGPSAPCDSISLSR